MRDRNLIWSNFSPIFLLRNCVNILFFFRDNLTLKEGGLDFEVNIYLQAQPAMAHDLSLVEPAQPPAYLWSVTFKRCLFIKRLSAIRFRFLWFCFADHTFDGRSPRGSDTKLTQNWIWLKFWILIELNESWREKKVSQMGIFVPSLTSFKDNNRPPFALSSLYQPTQWCPQSFARREWEGRGRRSRRPSCRWTSRTASSLPADHHHHKQAMEWWTWWKIHMS